MSRIAKRIKKNKEVFMALHGEENLDERLSEVMERGKKALDETCGEIGRMFAETLMVMDREEMSGEDYQPKSQELQKWGFQKGSVYVGHQKTKVSHPRLRTEGKEVSLRLYDRLKNPKEFSEEMLASALRGLSGRKYKETVVELANGFGISASSISNRFVEASYAKLKEFRERSLGEFKTFAIFIDTIHRGGAAFTVALGVDGKGKKKALGL